jgi:hypothetical protein
MTSTQERHTCICVHLLLRPDIVKIKRLLFYLSASLSFFLPLFFCSTLVDRGKITGAKRTTEQKKLSTLSLRKGVALALSTTTFCFVFLNPYVFTMHRHASCKG